MSSLSWRGWWERLVARKLIKVEGRTYPQEGMDQQGFRGYFFNSTTIVAVVLDKETAGKGVKPDSIQEAIGGRSMEEAIGGCYYVQVYCPASRAVQRWSSFVALG